MKKTRMPKRKPAVRYALPARLMIDLWLACDRHLPTVGVLLGIHGKTAQKRLRSVVRHEGLTSTFERVRELERERAGRARWRRYRWRVQLARYGVDPAALPLDDPMWGACHALPRGTLALQAWDALGRPCPVDEPLARAVVDAVLAARLGGRLGGRLAVGSRPG